MLCATFLTVVVVAFTATACKEDIMAIKEYLYFKNPLEIVANPNRPNIMYKKIFRKGNNVDFYKELLKPMANDLKKSKAAYPLTILYLPLKWCSFAYKYFEKQLCHEQYHHTGSEPLPENTRNTTPAKPREGRFGYI